MPPAITYSELFSSSCISINQTKNIQYCIWISKYNVRDSVKLELVRAGTLTVTTTAEFVFFFIIFFHLSWSQGLCDMLLSTQNLATVMLQFCSIALAYFFLMTVNVFKTSSPLVYSARHNEISPFSPTNRNWFRHLRNVNALNNYQSRVLWIKIYYSFSSSHHHMHISSCSFQNMSSF